MTTAAEQTTKIVRKVTLRNISDNIYRADDMELGESSILVQSKHEHVFSLKKATQVLRDFPNNWEFVSADEETMKILQESLRKTTEDMKATSSQHSLKTNDIPTPKKATQVKQVIANQGQIDAIISGIRKAEIEAREVKSEDLYTIVTQKGYVPVGDYKDKIEPFNGEIGSNYNAKTRYVVIEFKKTGKRAKNEDAKTDEVPEIRKSQEIDPEEQLPGIIANAADDLEKDLDPEDRHTPKKAKRVARQQADEDDDD